MNEKLWLLMRKMVSLLVLFLLCGCKGGPPRYNGYIDADLTYLSSDYSGRLMLLDVFRGDAVKKNQLLFRLEQTSEAFAVQMSQLSKDSLVAQKKQLEAQLHYAEINYHRTLLMQRDHAASQNDVDATKKDRDVLMEQLAGMAFQIQSSGVDTHNRQWQLDRKAGFSTNSGIIFDTYFTKGEYVQAGQPVLALITRRNIKLMFFVPEADLGRLSLGQKVVATSDGSKTQLVGRISFIANQAQYTAPIIYSRESRENLVFRIEARIEKPELRQIHLGQPVTLELVS